jgi:ribose 5-phosphate isomerase RpiB
MTEKLYPNGKVYLGSDESSYDVKVAVKSLITDLGFLVVDLGPFDIVDVADHSVLAREVAEKVLENENACEPGEPVSLIHGCESVGILIGTSGVSMLTVVGAMDGISASLCTTVEMATKAKNKGVNLLCLGLDETTPDLAKAIITEYLT